MQKKLQYESGDRFGRLMLTGKVYMKDERRYVEYTCDCRKIGWASWVSIKSSRTKSCGCLSSDLAAKRATTHNLCKHPLYRIWGGMNARCDDKNHAVYGAKGVTVCKEWKNDFKAFYDWAISNGYKKGLQLDKDKLSPHKTGIIYSPDFCCFITQTENMRYRGNAVILEYKGIKKPLNEWAELFGIRHGTIRRRIKKLEWSIDLALETPTNIKNRNAKYLGNI